MSKISIITTTYNHKDFIDSTIESILAQTFSDWELLIWDDNSSDNTYEIALEFAEKDSRIKVWKNSKNLWIVGNMNFLLSQVNPESKYIAFLEGDDMYASTNLEEKIKIFEQYPKVVLVDSNHEKIDKNWIALKQNKESLLWRIKHRKTRKDWLDKMSLLDLLKSGNIFQSFGTVMVRKDLLLNVYPFINLDKDNKMFWPLDYFLWINILPNHYFYHINKTLFLYRIHDNNFIKNITLMNHQIELIYDFIRLKTTDYKVLKICNFYSENNKMVSWFFEWKYKYALLHWLKSFYYNQTSLLFERIWIIILSVLPKTFAQIVIKKYKNM